MEKQKECFRCHTLKPLTEFYKHPEMPDGTVNKCKECNKLDNQQNWHKHRVDKLAYDQNRHRYSIQRIFNHRYAGIGVRCRGVGRTYHVTGKDFLTKGEWNTWCYAPETYKRFMRAYELWVQNNFNEKFAPSIDRVDNTKGYILGNLQWLTKSENCSKYTK